MRFTRHGQWEMIIGTVVLFAVALGLSFVHPLLGLLILPVWVWLLAFFRDPEREIPADAKAMVSPADGLVSDVTELESCDLVGGGPAVRVGIFLSVFNVHVNRSPCDGTVAQVIYKKGKFINAMSHASASSDNESNTIVLNEPGTQEAVCAVKQIVGLIARRIICDVKVGQTLVRGQRIGMIKFGSRVDVELGPEWEILVKPGMHVAAGSSVIAQRGRSQL